jgi:hypothetical protein
MRYFWGMREGLAMEAPGRLLKTGVRAYERQRHGVRVGVGRGAWCNSGGLRCLPRRSSLNRLSSKHKQSTSDAQAQTPGCAP